MGLVGFFVVCMVIAILSGSDDAISGLIVMGVTTFFVIGAFTINPILGIIVLFLASSALKNM